MSAAGHPAMNTPAENNHPDPWIHRSIYMRCESCMWWVEKIATNPRGDTGSLGRCRRHAPTMSGYPPTFADDWCGDHKLNENAR